MRRKLLLALVVWLMAGLLAVRWVPGLFDETETEAQTEAAVAVKEPTPPQAWVPGRELKPKPDPVLVARTQALARNPLARRTWGVPQQTSDDGIWRAYQGAAGEQRRLLGRIANAPRAIWFGDWISSSSIGGRVRDYIRESQRGDKQALVQMTLFRMVPWEHAACRRNPSGREAADYRAWMQNFAAAVGRTPTAIILQPDGPFALCSPGGPTGRNSPTRLIAWTAELLSALPNTSVYIEIGASDWPAPGQGGVGSVMEFLVPMGIEHARGIALNGTHYTDTADDIVHGGRVIEALAERGITGKKMVINTANQGNPWEFGHYRHKGLADNAPVCRSVPSNDTCVALGIPPTADVANPKWGHPREINKLAARYVDGYIWFGRPWLHMQASPFKLDRALGLARAWRWA